MGNLFRFFQGFPKTTSSSLKIPRQNDPLDSIGATPLITRKIRAAAVLLLVHKPSRFSYTRSSSNRKSIVICTHAVEITLASCETIIFAFMAKN